MEKITPETYHDDRIYASKSWLDKISDCPRLFHHRYHVEHDSVEDPLWATEGRALHIAVTEPELFPSKFIVSPKFDRRTKEGKQGFAEFIEYAGDRIMLDPETYSRVLAMTQSVRNHPLIKVALRAGEAEKVITWTDPTTGVKCKCMPDWLQSNGLVIDLKTTGDVSPLGFKNSVIKYRYNVQEAFYTDGIREATGIEPVFLFAAVSKESPYICEVFSLSEELVNEGRIQYINNLITLSRCSKNDHWPSYGDDKIIPIE